MRGAVKPVAPYAKSLMPVLRYRVPISYLGKLGVVRRVEHADYRATGTEPCSYGRNHRQGGRIVQRSQHGELRKCREVRVTEPRCRPEGSTAMDNAMHGRVESRKQVATVHRYLRQPRKHEISGLVECSNWC